jgi:hypothetical protein
MYVIGRSRLESGRPQELARPLVERAELIPAETGRRADVDLIADGRKEQRLGCDHAGARRIAERPQFEMRDGGMIPRASAVRCGPHLFAAIQVEGRKTPVWRFHERQPAGANDQSAAHDITCPYRCNRPR